MVERTYKPPETVLSRLEIRDSVTQGRLAWGHISEDEGGDVYLFLSSRAQKSGSTKRKSLHISGKTIVQYLTYIRETTSISDNNTPQSLSSQKYRHTFAMHALESGCTLEFVAKALGQHPDGREVLLSLPTEQCPREGVRQDVW